MNVKKSVWNLELAQVCLLLLLLLFLRYASSLLVHLCLPSFGRCTLEADLQMNCKLRMLDLKSGPKSTSQLWRNESGFFFYPLLSESLHRPCMQQGKAIFEEESEWALVLGFSWPSYTAVFFLHDSFWRKNMWRFFHHDASEEHDKQPQQLLTHEDVNMQDMPSAADAICW